MKKKVLFLCQGNACQSQMAEGLLNHFYKDKYEVFSAGLNPAELDKNAVDVMQEIGIDISNQSSKHINKLLNQTFDIIVTFTDIKNETAREEYPDIFKDALVKYNWKYFDPSEGIYNQKDLTKALREARDDLKEKIVEHFK